jgi:hypothetical protein
MALLYSVNKPQVLGRIVRWLFLFLEYDFITIYKPCKIHVIADVLSKLLDTTKPRGIPRIDHKCQLVFHRPKWLNVVKNFLQIGQMEKSLSTRPKQRLTKRVEPFIMKNDVLYKMG